MTLAEKLAREAAPCMYDDPDVGSKSCEDIGACGGTFGPCEKCACRPAIQAAIEETIRACHRIHLDAQNVWDYADKIANLITEDVEDGG